MARDLNDLRRERGPGSIREALDATALLRNGADHANGFSGTAWSDGFHPDLSFDERVKKTAAEIELKLICVGALLQKETPKRKWFCYPWFPE
jgi:hypothetical protein